MTLTYRTERLCRLCDQPLTRHQTAAGSVVCSACLDALLFADELEAETELLVVEGPSGALYCHRDHSQITAGSFCPACGEA